MATGIDKPKQPSDRRTFLKIGAGVVAGAAIASVVEIPYYSNVIGGNNNSSSTTVSSLQDELSTTKSQLSDTQNSLSATQNSLSAAQGTISNLNSQLTATQGSLTSANSQLSNAQSSLSAANSQNAAIAQQLTSTEGYLSTANEAISTLETQVSNANSQVSSLQSQTSSLQTQVYQLDAFVALTPANVELVQAIAELMIPTDSNGPGAMTAGVVYFVDRQLAGRYGYSGRMYMNGPFIAPNLAGPITVDGITYPNGSMVSSVGGPVYWQHPMSLRDFWLAGLSFFQAYANSAYGGNFQTLSAANQTACLTDIWNNKPTNFTSMLPVEFAQELAKLVWGGFLSDPIQGGNRGMVGWLLVGANGVNQGDFYGEGYLTSELMISTDPPILKPASIGQLQQSLGENQ